MKYSFALQAARQIQLKAEGSKPKANTNTAKGQIQQKAQSQRQIQMKAESSKLKA
jgi:hypothetical protein